MAERIDIVVTERGARTVRRDIENIGDGAQAAQGAVQLLRRALGALGVALGVREIVNVVDTFTNLQNRLRTVTDGTAELAVVTDDLFAIANRTRTSFESTVEVFSRTALAARDLGLSQQQVIGFTESLNQAVILSGASATEAQAGLIQLSQGLAAGALRGEELNSVLEQLPVVADVIAESLGVTRGQLRELGAQGAITAPLIVNAFEEARESLAEGFGEAVPTIGQAFVVFRDNIIRFVGGLDQATGASSFLASAILNIAQNMETLGRITGAVAFTIGTVFAVQALGAATRGLITLGALIAANPIGALALAVTATVSALAAFADQLTLSEGSLTTLQDVGLAAFEALQRGVQTAVDFFAANFGFIAEFSRRVFGDVEFSIEGVLRTAANVVDGVVGFFRGAATAAELAFSDLPVALELVFVRAVNNAISAFQTLISLVVRGLNVLGAGLSDDFLDAFEGLRPALSQEADNLGRSIDQAISEAIQNQSAATDTLEGILARANEITRERLEAERQAAEELAAARAGLGDAGTDRTAGRQSQQLQEFIRDLQRENELLQLNNDERAVREALFRAEDAAKRELTEAERQQIVALVEQNRALEAQSQLLQEIRGPAEDYADQVEALEALLQRGAISTEEFARQFRSLRLEFLDTQTDTFSGFERGFLRAIDQVEDFAATSERLITDAFSQAQDAVVEFANTGRLELDDLFRSISNNLIRLGTQQLFAGTLGSQGFLGQGGIGGLFGGGGAGGGIGGLFSGLLGFQNGASNVPVDRLAVGNLTGADNRLVAFRARSDETVSVNRPGESNQRPVSVQFNFPPGTDVDSFRRSEGQIAARTAAALSRASSRNN